MAYTLVAVFAHPDDEALFAGGLLAKTAASGARVELLTLTHGEAGYSRFGDSKHALALRRRRELAAACSALSVHAFSCFRFPDGQLTAVDPEAGIQTVEHWLWALDADVVVTFGPDGGYGHADHVTTGSWTRSAAARLPRPPRVLEPVFPRDLWTSARPRLERFLAQELLPVPRSGLGGASDTAPLQLPLSTSLAATKRRAVAAHESQLPDGDPLRVLAPGLLNRLCERECYRVAGGPALPGTSENPFEGLPQPLERVAFP